MQRNVTLHVHCLSCFLYPVSLPFPSFTLYVFSYRQLAMTDNAPIGSVFVILFLHYWPTILAELFHPEDGGNRILRNVCHLQLRISQNRILHRESHSEMEINTSKKSNSQEHVCLQTSVKLNSVSWIRHQKCAIIIPHQRQNQPCMFSVFESYSLQTRENIGFVKQLKRVTGHKTWGTPQIMMWITFIATLFKH
jgi:hypothetical protein